MPKYRGKIRCVFVKHISRAVFDYLAAPLDGSGPHIDPRLYGRL
jgi:hypothetical protein